MKHFKPYSRQDLLNRTRLRRYETKLGEKLRTPDGSMPWTDALAASTARYVLAGIPESIGVTANRGIPGTETAWSSFVDAIVNVQSTDRFTGDEVIMAGYFDFTEVQKVIDSHSMGPEEKVDACRHAVANIIDEEVEAFVKVVTTAGKMPILVGGGHNNAYPIIKGAAKGVHRSGRIPRAQVNAINLDAHADYRIMEGRHSGNAFRYAVEEGYLGRYAVFGLHENYNPQSILDDLYSNVSIQYTFWEDIFLHERMNFTQAMAQAFSFTDDTYVTIDLDLDAITGALSSAMSPTGISVTHARQFMNFAGTNPQIAALHICEGAERLLNGLEDSQTGKLIACLVSDFVKANL